MTWRTLLPKRSLQWRLTLSLTAVISALWLAAVLAANTIVRSEADKVFDSALKAVAQRVLPLAYIELLNRERDSATDLSAIRLPSVDPEKETITYIVRDSSGRVVMQSNDAIVDAFPIDLRSGFHDRMAERFYTESAVRGTVFVTTKESGGQRQAAVYKATIMLFWPLIALLPISIFGVWSLVAWSLKPLLEWQGEIEARGRGNLAPVNATNLPSELAPIATSVDKLIARLRQAIEAERSFTGNSAHELRTPVAAALAQTQRLIAELRDDALGVRARSIETALHDLSRLSEKLLQLAKAEGGSLVSDKSYNLAEVLRIVVTDHATAPSVSERLIIRLPSSGIFMSLLDADAFAILARNLIENALKHGNVDEPIEVALDGQGIFSVGNHGAVISPHDLSRLTRPFERGATKAKGSGLGLAIAAAVATGAGTRLQLASPLPGQLDGFEVKVLLPSPSIEKSTDSHGII
ncbi:MAG: HAMP domain-containing histidine kinase [Hyphomicrobiaceae bacterium]|nr:HAMP domain-containing histidine kinase [Hyphomicrobiaceae bacterium]